MFALSARCNHVGSGFRFYMNVNMNMNMNSFQFQQIKLCNRKDSMNDYKTFGVSLDVEMGLSDYNPPSGASKASQVC